MKLSRVLLINALFASTSPAARYSLAYNLPTRFPPPQSFDHAVDSYYETYWAGGVLLNIAGGSYNEVETQFIVPTMTAPTSGDGSWYMTILVGIDGFSNMTTMLFSGLYSGITVTNGLASTVLILWYEWYPADAVYLYDIAVNTNDVIFIKVAATSSTTGQVVINNLSTKSTNSYNVTPPSNSYALSGYNTEWVIESITLPDGSQSPLPNFGTFGFSACKAQGSGMSFTGDDAQLVDIKEGNGDILTESSLPGDSVVDIKYLASE